MANNADNIAVVRPQTSGCFMVGAKNAALPTSASAAATGFNDLGILGPDGIAMTIGRETKDLDAFGGDVALTIQTKHDVSLKMRPLEFNEHTAKQAYGDANVTAADGKVSKVIINSAELGEHPCVIELMNRARQLVRICVPRLVAVENMEINMKHDDASLVPEMNYKCLPDAQGNKAYIYIGEPAA